MKKARIQNIGLLICLFLILTLTNKAKSKSIIQSDDNLKIDDINRTKHEPIYICKDDDFQEYEFPGEGTKSKPYLIKNLEIGEVRRGIYIWNTTRYFVIQNCLIKSGLEGIRIENVTSGTAYVSENLCISIGFKSIGIVLTHSNNATILQNLCINLYFSDYTGGILVENSNYTVIQKNECSNNNFGIAYSCNS